MIRIILFDWFGVLCSKALLMWAEKHVRSEEIPTILALADRLDAGKIPLAEFRIGLGGLVNQSPDQVRLGLAEEVQVDQEMVDLVRQLKNRFRVGILSNVNAEFLSEILIKGNLDTLFDPVIASSQLGVIKPDPQIYSVVQDQLSCASHEILLVDDNKANVEAALELGWNGIVFDSTSALKEDLKKLELH